MISKVENDKLRPSINMLHEIATALETTMAALFADLEAMDDPVLLFREWDRPRLGTDKSLAGEGAWFERLLPVTRSGLLQANILNIPPGVRSSGKLQHNGEELGFVIRGQLDILVDGTPYFVKAGDAFFFPSSLSHGYRNDSDEVAIVLWVNTPPSL